MYLILILHVLSSSSVGTTPFVSVSAVCCTCVSGDCHFQFKQKFTSQHHLSVTDDVYICLFCEILLHKYHIDGKHVRVYQSLICQQTSFLAMANSKYGH